MNLDDLKQKISGDSFALLGLPHRFAVDSELLKKNYLALSRATHPDFYTGDPDGLAEILAISAAVNDAYRTLDDPVRRAEYVLMAHGGKDAGEDKRVPPEMLGEVLMLNEEIEEAREANNQAALDAFRSQMQARRASLLQTVEMLADILTQGGDPTSVGERETLDALRLELNAMKYVHNLLMQLGCPAASWGKQTVAD